MLQRDWQNAHAAGLGGFENTWESGARMEMRKMCGVEEVDDYLIQAYYDEIDLYVSPHSRAGSVRGINSHTPLASARTFCPSCTCRRRQKSPSLLILAPGGTSRNQLKSLLVQFLRLRGAIGAGRELVDEYATSLIQPKRSASEATLE
jgi:hypothetical protein